MKALPGREGKSGRALRLAFLGVGPEEGHGQEGGHLAPALVGRHVLGRGLFDGLHRNPGALSNLYPESNYELTVRGR